MTTSTDPCPEAGDPTGLSWRRSSFCTASSCVEVADDGAHVWLRDSKQPHQAPLRFTRLEWDHFVAGVRNGDFDAA